MPYPGVEWFNSMRDHQYNPRKIVSSSYAYPLVYPHIGINSHALPVIQFFNWEHREVSVALGLPPSCASLRVPWKDYKTWDLVSLTQNYLRVLIDHISGQGEAGTSTRALTLCSAFIVTLLTGTQGILVHCVSGWDRTPLFVSLLRLSLWAVGFVTAVIYSVQVHRV
jgi:myotubularin-related protein 14